ncbi:hypothetical protein H5410_033040 [Solanum commersonii]|uniref:Uncharacterized protein n=1 Tax=Solanum commersonii TaxID=4109 RepID=A0A9J5YRX6_SOLCO|nr:hypothetical protein H5410_033040 [Solanum commersonii]
MSLPLLLFVRHIFLSIIPQLTLSLSISRRCEKIFYIFSNFRLTSLIVSIYWVLIRSLQQLHQYISDTEFGVMWIFSYPFGKFG